MWCWWPICYVGDMKFNLVPNSIIFFPSLNRSWGTYIGHQHHNTPECDVGDWYLMLVPNSRCWWRDLSPTSKSCHQHIWSPTSVTNIDVTGLFFWFFHKKLIFSAFSVLQYSIRKEWRMQSHNLPNAILPTRMVLHLWIWMGIWMHENTLGNGRIASHCVYWRYAYLNKIHKNNQFQ